LPGVEKGRRNDSAAKLVGLCIELKFDDLVIKDFMMTWDRGNNPPLGEVEPTILFFDPLSSYHGGFENDNSDSHGEIETLNKASTATEVRTR